jgi:hypothetical protein
MTQTEQEVRAIALEWVHKHCPAELKTAETGGLAQPDVTLINNFLQEHCGGLWSIDNLNRAVDMLRDQLTWRSKADLEYQAAWQSLNADQQAQFTAWWNGPAKKYVRLDGEEGFANASRILTWAKNHTWSADVFDRACQNLFSTQGLYPAPRREQGERRGHVDDGKGFMSKSETNVSAVERSRRDRERQESNQPKTGASPDDPNSAEWLRKAEALTGSTHSDKAILARMAGRSHHETYLMRQRYLNSKQRANYSKTAV